MYMGNLKIFTLAKSEHIGTERDLWLFLAHWVSNCSVEHGRFFRGTRGLPRDSKEQKADRCPDFLPSNRIALNLLI